MRAPLLALAFVVGVLVSMPASALASPLAPRADQSAAAATGPSSAQAKPQRLKALETQVLRQLNGFRRNHGRKRLKGQKQLRQAALAHARSMATKGFFSHDSANGETFDARIKRYYRVVGFGSWTVGENLLWASGGLTAKRSIVLWRNSSGHRRNMLERGWRQVGVAAVRMSSAPGEFDGLDVTIVVTDFGSRS